jgi:hypothetical protein
MEHSTNVYVEKGRKKFVCGMDRYCCGNVDGKMIPNYVCILLATNQVTDQIAHRKMSDPISPRGNEPEHDNRDLTNSAENGLITTSEDFRSR